VNVFEIQFRADSGIGCRTLDKLKTADQQSCAQPIDSATTEVAKLRLAEFAANLWAQTAYPKPGPVRTAHWHGAEIRIRAGMVAKTIHGQLGDVPDPQDPGSQDSGQPKPDQPEPDQPEPNQPRADQPGPGQSEPVQPGPGQQGQAPPDSAEKPADGQKAPDPVQEQDDDFAEPPTLAPGSVPPDEFPASSDPFDDFEDDDFDDEFDDDFEEDWDDDLADENLGPEGAPDGKGDKFQDDPDFDK
jgi:hypothetical protein